MDLFIYERAHHERLKFDAVHVSVGFHHFNFHVTPVLTGAHLKSCLGIRFTTLYVRQGRTEEPNLTQFLYVRQYF